MTVRTVAGRSIPALVAVALLAAACGGSSPPPTQRYYDPEGLFSAEFPQSNDVVVVPPQTVEGAAKILSGVLSEPPQPTAQATSGGFAGPLGGAQATPPPDLALYTVFVVDAADVTSVDALADTLLSSSPNRDLQILSSQLVGTRPGLLIVNDHPAVGYTDASGFVLFDGRGYWVRELFPMGQWSQRRDGFQDLLRTFRFDVPPTIASIPIGRPPLLLRSGTFWPIG